MSIKKSETKSAWCGLHVEIECEEPQGVFTGIVVDSTAANFIIREVTLNGVALSSAKAQVSLKTESIKKIEILVGRGKPNEATDEAIQNGSSMILAHESKNDGADVPSIGFVQLPEALDEKYEAYPAQAASEKLLEALERNKNSANDQELALQKSTNLFQKRQNRRTLAVIEIEQLAMGGGSHQINHIGQLVNYPVYVKVRSEKLFPKENPANIQVFQHRFADSKYINVAESESEPETTEISDTDESLTIDDSYDSIEPEEIRYLEDKMAESEVEFLGSKRKAICGPFSIAKNWILPKQYNRADLEDQENFNPEPQVFRKIEDSSWAHSVFPRSANNTFCVPNRNNQFGKTMNNNFRRADNHAHVRAREMAYAAYDEHILIPVVNCNFRGNMTEICKNYGFTADRMIESFARGISDLAISMLIQFKRGAKAAEAFKTQKNVVIICDASFDQRCTTVGCAVGRILSTHGVSIMTYLLEDDKRDLFENPEFKLFVNCCQQPQIHLQELFTPDLIIVHTYGDCLPDDISDWISETNAAVLAVDPVSFVSRRFTIDASIFPYLPLEKASAEICGAMYLCNLGIPDAIFRKAGVADYKSPFQGRNVIQIHRRPPQ